MLEPAARKTVVVRYSVRLEASRANFSCVELDHQPFTDPKREKSGRAPDPPPRATYKSVIWEEQTGLRVLCIAQKAHHDTGSIAMTVILSLSGNSQSAR